jgi:hypothetical protein
MTVTIKVSADFKPLRAVLEGFSQRRLASTIATALTRTAMTAREETRKAIGQVFDRPTAWAQRSVWMKAASANKLEARVYLVDRRGDPQDQPYHYLYPQVFAGKRGRKGYENLLAKARVLPDGFVTVPGNGAKLDAYGNQSRGELVQILSALKAGPTAGAGRGYSFNRTAQSAKRRGSRLRDIFFSSPALQQKAANGGRLPWGVWERMKDGRIQCLLFFVRPPGYNKRLPLFEIKDRVMARDFQREYDRAFEASLARLRARG